LFVTAGWLLLPTYCAGPVPAKYRSKRSDYEDIKRLKAHKARQQLYLYVYILCIAEVDMVLWMCAKALLYIF